MSQKIKTGDKISRQIQEDEAADRLVVKTFRLTAGMIDYIQGIARATGKNESAVIRAIIKTAQKEGQK